MPPFQTATVTPPPYAATVQTAETSEPPSDSRFGVLTLAPGFIPDPATMSGTVEVQDLVDASTLGSSCIGQISRNPDHLLIADGDFANLRVLAFSEVDITLVVQSPDDTYRCNDDAEGLNPIVEGPFPQGVYRIWVGTYQREERRPSTYTIGFSELNSVTPRSLPH